MAVITVPDPLFESSRPASSQTPVDRQLAHLFESAGIATRWNLTERFALLALFLLWAARMYSTWATWGNLSIDAGHEMYVPAMLAQGKMLYRDVWYLYGPAAPYFNSYLFRLFGLHLNVLYWAGSLAALGSSLLLFLVGIRLSSWLVGWTAAAVVLLQAFHSWLFSFPLPYSFASVYGCLIACLFLWLAINGSLSRNWIWTFGAGTAAAAALLLKLEYGIACYATLLLLIAVRGLRQRSMKSLAVDFVSTLPGVVACVLVIHWMISIAGIDFITQENIMSWPTSYFMKTFGKAWLERTGFTVSGHAFVEAMFRAVPVGIAILASYCILRWNCFDKRANLLKKIFVFAAVSYFFLNNFLALPFPQAMERTLSTVFFPQDMVLYVIVAAFASWLYFWPKRSANVGCNPAIPLLLTFSSLLAFRILMKMDSAGYPIYYNGPVVLSFLLLLCLIVPRSARSRRFIFLGELVLCLACLTPVALSARAIAADAKSFVPLTTERGTIYASEPVAANYRAAIQFMNDAHSHGESVLAVPEDTSLYFLSGTECPTRVFIFIPGVVAPGHMTDELIQEIERKKVRYLLWSNRIFPEYGAPVFGKDFAQPLGDYFRSHYRRVGRLAPNINRFSELSLTVWERKSEGVTNDDSR